MVWYIYRREKSEIRLTNPSKLKQTLLKLRGYELVYKEKVI